MITKRKGYSPYEWTPRRIADAILSWANWPGIEATHCGNCGCEMNVP